MLTIADRALSADARTELAGHQRAVDRVTPFADRVDEGKAAWRRLRARQTSCLGPDGEVAETLKSMCLGIERCMYCEDSVGHQIEHGWPKHHYPGRVFDWTNMLYACQPCNGPKSARFTVCRDEDGYDEELAQSRGTPPPVGQALLIDPRSEDPRAYFELDLETGRLLIRDGLGSRDRRRAAYTLSVLRLNTRSPLPKARCSAYGNFRARLAEYVRHKQSGAEPAVLIRLRDELLGINHPTVWVEMVAQADAYDELRALFDEAPEARCWHPGAASDRVGR